MLWKNDMGLLLLKNVHVKDWIAALNNNLPHRSAVDIVYYTGTRFGCCIRPSSQRRKAKLVYFAKDVITNGHFLCQYCFDVNYLQRMTIQGFWDNMTFILNISRVRKLLFPFFILSSDWLILFINFYPESVTTGYQSCQTCKLWCTVYRLKVFLSYKIYM